MADGKRRHGGLADRLRSYLTYYGYCQRHGIRFAINFTSPFNLEDYLEPNSYDWRLRPGELTFNSEEAHPFPFVTSGPLDDFERSEQKKLVDKYIGGGKYKQYHLYSNYCFDEEDFPKYFKELFKPAPHLASVIEECKRGLGEAYISVSTRFLELLGDFEEPRKREKLDASGQSKLISRCREEVEKLHARYPGMRIFLTSDSRKFLDACRDLPYVFMAEGEINHIDKKDEGADHTKTFVDFLLIGGAEKVFQIKCGPMYAGNFSLRSAGIHGRPYQLIECSL